MEVFTISQPVAVPAERTIVASAGLVGKVLGVSVEGQGSAAELRRPEPVVTTAGLFRDRSLGSPKKVIGVNPDPGNFEYRIDPSSPPRAWPAMSPPASPATKSKIPSLKSSSFPPLA